MSISYFSSVRVIKVVVVVVVVVVEEKNKKSLVLLAFQLDDEDE